MTAALVMEEAEKRRRTETAATKRRTAAVAVAASLFLLSPARTVFAQTEPETPPESSELRNGYQISFYTGLSWNQFNGEYYGSCPCDFVAEERSWTLPFGASVNIPLWSDAALYFRAGVHSTKTTFFTGRNDTLISAPGVFGEVGDELELEYSIFHADILLRLIGKMDGERVFVGPSFGFVSRKRARITETEYETGYKAVVEDRDIEGGKSMRYSLVIGAEYAIVPAKNLYIIPSIQIDYSPQKISSVQLIRPLFYKLLLSIAYQLF